MNLLLISYNRSASPIGEKEKTMKQAMKITQWVLGVAGALSLLVGVIYKIIYITIPDFIPNSSPMGFLVFTAVCSLASIALSLLKITKIIRTTFKRVIF